MRARSLLALAAFALAAAPAVARAEPPTSDAGAPPPVDAGPSTAPDAAVPWGVRPPDLPVPGEPTTPPAPTAPAAPPPAAPEPPPAAPAAAPARDPAWQRRYDEARERLLAGDFAAAAALFTTLADETRDPIDRALAINQAALAIEWSRRGAVLRTTRTSPSRTHEPVPAMETHEPVPAMEAPAPDVRTADELGVLYASSVLYGVGTGGWTAVVGEAKSSAPVILPMLVFSGAAAGTVAILDSGRPLRYGVPQSIVSGLYIGLEEGIVWSLWNQSLEQSSNHWSDKGIASVIWGFSTAGAIAGGAIGAAVGTTPGRASSVGSAALWSSAVLGLTVGAATGNDGNNRATNALVAAGLGLNAGAVVGMLTAGGASPSIARMRFVDLGGVAGGLLLGGLYAAAAENTSNPQAGLGLTATGIAAGLALAWVATAGMPRDEMRTGNPDVHAEARAPKLRWDPTLIPANGGMQLGVAGSM